MNKQNRRRPSSTVPIAPVKYLITMHAIRQYLLRIEQYFDFLMEPNGGAQEFNIFNCQDWSDTKVVKYIGRHYSLTALRQLKCRILNPAHEYLIEGDGKYDVGTHHTLIIYDTRVTTVIPCHMLNNPLHKKLPWP